MILLRALARLITFVLLLALAVTGLVVAIFSIRGEDRPLSIPALAENLRLHDLRETVGDFLDQLEAPGDIALLSALCGLGALLLGLMLLAGALSSRKERLMVLEREDGTTLAARRRPLGQVAAALVEQAKGVTATKVKVKPKRRREGGWVEVTAIRTADATDGDVKQAASEALAPLTDDFGLRARVRPKLGEAGQRVQ